ncbi:MAG: DEAD/DEAH box helicase family protein [Nitrosomonadaceae bacterium]|nr:DEAD/DEAH box helicase family protein [Nitrosomonadaceae bacterium]
MNEAETRAEHIDPALKAAGWGVVEGSRIRREIITLGRLQDAGQRAKPEIADYVLVYRNRKLAVVEAKAWDKPYTEGVAQAKAYAGKMAIRYTYATNGQKIYGIDMQTGHEGDVAAFPSPDELWAMTFAEANAWRDRFAAVPFEDKGGSHPGRYYQDIAVERVMEAIAEDQMRILLTLATGTGKTFIAFQIAWKLFHSRWNLNRDAGRRPRILFLADRNILANQAYNAFSTFPEDALVRIAPEDIRKKGRVPKNGSIFFTIFQTFMASAGSATGPQSNVETHFDEISEIKDAFGYMYLLECADGSLYTGSTTNLRARLQQHNDQEGARHTATRGPVKLIYYETFDRIDEAFAREKQVQGWGREKKAALTKGNIDLLKQLSRGRSVPEPVEAAVPEPVEAAVPEPVEGYFGDYPPDFFDFIIIDECHRGGANDESNWRDILEYFAPAVQLGLTATPKRKDNVDTYAYFGEPVYVYSLKEGINDGFLTPFRVRQYATTLDEYVYTSDDKLVEGEIEAGKLYEEKDFNCSIEIVEREKYRVKLFMESIDQREKTLVFCANQGHALLVRDLINQTKTVTDPCYCVRVTADDGERGEQFLRDFQDNEKTIPTILTTSQKLSTGVDARNIRNIVLLRPINSMIEFKQIIGRGTRLYDGKDYFTIYDFVKAHHHFSDAEWDGEPLEPEAKEAWPVLALRPPAEAREPAAEYQKREKIKVKLADGKARTIQHIMVTTFWGQDGKPLSAAEFLNILFGDLPEFFKDEDELRAIWSMPDTRKKLLDGLAEKGFGKDQLAEMQKIIDAENSDLFDVLAHVAFALVPLTREERAAQAIALISTHFNHKQQVFLDFVLSHYVSVGVEELDQAKLTPLLRLKYHDSIADAVADLGKPDEIGRVFSGFQKYLYQETA